MSPIDRPFFSADIAPGYRWSTDYGKYVRADSGHFQPQMEEELTDADRWENEQESRRENRQYYP